MQFRIWSSNLCLDREVGELIDRYPCLKNFGLELIGRIEPQYTLTRDETGNFIHHFGDIEIKCAYINIDTIEQLLELEEASGSALIVTQDTIEIYDDYRE